jgi:hypothetical protein
MFLYKRFTDQVNLFQNISGPVRLQSASSFLAKARTLDSFDFGSGRLGSKVKCRDIG